ncbi:MAG: hypothetical protein ACM33T_04335 [Solirubrobacterales bacterium]
MCRQALAVAVVVTCLTATPVWAADLHQLWDRQCGGCHGHAGDFARTWLHVADGQLAGTRQPGNIEYFLGRHNGGYPAEVIAGMTTMLRAQAEAPDTFRQRCSSCHGTAAQLARESLVSVDGRLTGRRSKRDVAMFLTRHGDLEDAEIPLMLDVLTRVEGEVHRQ